MGPLTKLAQRLKLIFLDFDGVLNSYRTVFAAPGKENGWDPEHLDPVSIGLVRKLCDLTGAKIVISSTWRDHFTNDELKEILAKKGWPDAPIIGRTASSLSWRFRGGEVADWLEEFVNAGNEIESYVILDDNNWFFTGDGEDDTMRESGPGPFRKNQPLVKTDQLDGMTIDALYAALQYLDPEHPKIHSLRAILQIR